MLTLAGCLVLTGCGEPRPRSYAEFMEDDFAREGTLVRCNSSREATRNDLECANARRAATTVALIAERERRAVLEAESERLRAELRERTARQQEAERIAEELRRAALQAAYDAQWVAPGHSGQAPAVHLPPGLFGDAPLNPADELFGRPGADHANPGQQEAESALDSALQLPAR